MLSLVCNPPSLVSFTLYLLCLLLSAPGVVGGGCGGGASSLVLQARDVHILHTADTITSPVVEIV